MLQVIGVSLVNAIAFYLIFVYIIAWLKLAADLRAGVALQINSLNMVVLLAVILARVAAVGPHRPQADPRRQRRSACCCSPGR